MRKYLFFVQLLLISCAGSLTENSSKKASGVDSIKGVSLVVLGTVQDGGSPHAGCKKDCCKDLFEKSDNKRMVISLGLIDCNSKKKWLFEATPDLPRQMKMLHNLCPFENAEIPDGIFLTHAHIGHYSGLMYLGREAMGTKGVPVFAMPKMKGFLEENGPWSQLVKLKNIDIQSLKSDSTINISNHIKITPFLVPHRDEYSETVGFLIESGNKKLLFIPDINKWEKWTKNIVEEIRKVDFALIDATFYDGAEINNRPISEIPHPFVIESMEFFKNLSKEDKNKIYFIHLNHTNPLLNESSKETELVIKNGFNIARMGQVIKM